MPLDQLTEQHFIPYLQQRFTLHLSETEVIDLTLIKVEPINQSPFRAVWETENATPRRKPFSLFFRGPAQHPLRQRMYLLKHEQLGPLADLFLTAIGADAQGRYYEALFN